MATKLHEEPELRLRERAPILRCRGMTLQEVLAGIPADPPLGNSELPIASLAYSSRKAVRDTLFFAIRGEKTDGNLFVNDAIERGATAICSEMAQPWNAEWEALYAKAAQAPGRREMPRQVNWVRVRDARKAMALGAANFYGRPAEKLKLVGITGTNGKTTTSFLVDSILRAAGHIPGLFGTISYRTPRAKVDASTTTPESLDLQKFLSEVREAGGDAAVMEASSHALAMDRLWGLQFDVAIFSNLTRDHLDYHKTFEDYFAAKRRLFEGVGKGAARAGVTNTDDPYGKQLVGIAAKTLTYGLTNGAQIIAKNYEISFNGLKFTAQTPAGKIEIESPLMGKINVYNILAAIGAGIALGISNDTIAQGIAALKCVPGRFERVECGQPFLVIVDYAHTDDALKNLLATAKEISRGGRIITLFGCGGDRDRTKRPLMGEAAGRASDMVILTSDNPRSEDPLLIINDALVGLQRTRTPYKVEADRERALAIALDEAHAGDIVLLAGKGHETYQVLKGRTIEFDDRKMAVKILHERGYEG